MNGHKSCIKNILNGNGEHNKNSDKTECDKNGSENNFMKICEVHLKKCFQSNQNICGCEKRRIESDTSINMTEGICDPKIVRSELEKMCDYSIPFIPLTENCAEPEPKCEEIFGDENLLPRRGTKCVPVKCQCKETAVERMRAIKAKIKWSDIPLKRKCDDCEAERFPVFTEQRDCKGFPKPPKFSKKFKNKPIDCKEKEKKLNVCEKPIKKRKRKRTCRVYDKEPDLCDKDIIEQFEGFL